MKLAICAKILPWRSKLWPILLGGFLFLLGTRSGRLLNAFACGVSGAAVEGVAADNHEHVWTSG